MLMAKIYCKRVRHLTDGRIFMPVSAAQAHKISAEAQKVSELQKLLHRSRQVRAEIHQNL